MFNRTGLTSLNYTKFGTEGLKEKICAAALRRSKKNCKTCQNIPFMQLVAIDMTADAFEI